MSDKMLYIEVTDSIGDIVAKLSNSNQDEVIVVVPRGAVLLQSLVNLKLLKSQAEKLGKTITLSTEGGLAENLARDAGISLIETLNPRQSEKITLEDESTSKMDTIQDESEETSEEYEQELIDEDQETTSPHGFRRIKFPETTIEDDGVSFPAPIPVTAISKNAFKSLTRIRLPKLHFRLESHQKTAILIVLAGLVILGSVGYFVVPRAYAALEVQSEPYQKQFSLIVADQDDLKAAGPNIVTGRYLEVVHENTASFDATGEKNRGAKAEGKITIINTTATIAGLLANTRFQAPNGLIYRSKFEILVPPAHGSSAGRAIVDAVADEGGAKYNLSAGTHLILPGLGQAGRDSVYGEISATFAGGTDDIAKVVSEADINKAKEEAAKNVFASAKTELATKLKKGEQIPDNFVQNDIIDALPSVSIGTEQDKFDVRVSSRSWTLAIKEGKLAEALSNAANFEVPEGKQVTTTTLKNAKTEVVQSNFLTHRINLVVSLDGRIGPKLDLPAITDKLANQSLDNAKKYLSTIENVSSSSIEIWPSIIKKVPMLRGNIHTRVVYLGE